MSKQFLDLNGLELYHENLTDWVDAKTVELTQAEYDALPESEKLNGTEYFITDGQGGGGGGGTSDYEDLDNQPSINNVTLIGNKTSADLGLVANATGQSLTFGVDQNGILTVTY